jgi:hypothetical protein
MFGLKSGKGLAPVNNDKVLNSSLVIGIGPLQ